jgi:tetratricopeptide (TPR) repeat protein
VETFDKALTRAPNSVDALSGAAETHRAAMRLDRALDLFKKAAEQSTEPVPAMRVAETLISMGRLGEAEQILTSTIAAQPRLGGAHYLLAVVAEQRGDRTRAEREYRLEMGLTPWDHRAAFNLAVLAGNRRDFQTQVELLESIPRIAPDFAEVHFFLAKALLDLGDRRRFQEAIAAARRGLQLAPESPQAPLGRYVLADLYTLEGRVSDAARELRLGRQLEDRVSGTGKRH